MDFRISRDKKLCIDLTKTTTEELSLVMNTVISTCTLLQQQGRKLTIKKTHSPKEYAAKQIS